jgi:hypothetical protein
LGRKERFYLSCCLLSVMLADCVPHFGDVLAK